MDLMIFSSKRKIIVVVLLLLASFSVLAMLALRGSYQAEQQAVNNESSSPQSTVTLPTLEPLVAELPTAVIEQRLKSSLNASLENLDSNESIANSSNINKEFVRKISKDYLSQQFQGQLVPSPNSEQGNQPRSNSRAGAVGSLNSPDTDAAVVVDNPILFNDRNTSCRQDIFMSRYVLQKLESIVSAPADGLIDSAKASKIDDLFNSREFQGLSDREKFSAVMSACINGQI